MISLVKDPVKALEPLFDLQEAQGKTSNMAPRPTFRRGNLEKSSALRWSDAPNLGAPKFFWEFSYTYILIIKRVFVVTTHFTFFSKDDPQIPDYEVHSRSNFSIGCLKVSINISREFHFQHLIQSPQRSKEKHTFSY